MPVTAKLSQKFYQKFGDDLTNELVDWLNHVDASQHHELQRLNELNFARFDAKLEQRTAQLEAMLEQRTAQLEARLDAGLARLEGGLLARIGMAEGRLARLTLVFWVATMGSLIAVLKL
jgi:hypothetical protein